MMLFPQFLLLGVSWIDLSLVLTFWQWQWLSGIFLENPVELEQ
jgi:hypothetical protein